MSVLGAIVMYVASMLSLFRLRRTEPSLAWPFPAIGLQGYAVIAEELIAKAGDPDECPWTHVILQGGVGGLAAGVAAGFWDRYGARRPRVLVVEPEQADCLFQSAIEGRPSRASGSVDSAMAELACGETSPLAWRFMQPSVDAFMTVSDAQAEAAMRALADGPHGDVPIVACESAVAGLAALQALQPLGEDRRAAGLDSGSCVLIVSTEGATAPGVYAAIVGRPAGEVLASQCAWLAREELPEDRLMQRLHEHAAIGAIDGGGVCRIALTDADRQGRDQLVRWIEALGLEVRVDRIGNVFGIRAGRRDAAPVMTGSPIDTVATGGRYDGNYGVLAGLEVVRWLDERGIETDRPLVVAAFTNEEGVCFQPDMMGSLVYAGGYPLQQALDGIGTDGARLGDELARIGYAGDMACGSIVPHAFVELHIEQGTVMEAEGIGIGAVQDLQGSPGRPSPSRASPTTPARRRCACAATPATARRRWRCSCASSRSATGAARSRRSAPSTCIPT